MLMKSRDDIKAKFFLVHMCINDTKKYPSFETVPDFGGHSLFLEGIIIILLSYPIYLDPFWFPKTLLVIILCDQVIASVQMNNGDNMSFLIDEAISS